MGPMQAVQVRSRSYQQQGSSSSQDTFDGTAKPDDEIKELPADDRPSASWAEQASTAQAPALTYHATPSASTLSSASGIFECYAAEPVRKRFKAPFQSHILDREVGNPKPWMNGRTTVKRDKRSYFTTLFGIFVGLALGIFVIVKDALHVDHYNYCPVLDDEFNGDSLDYSKWRVEQRLGGGESNDFTWYTGHNSYVADGNLWIVPTLTNETMLPIDYAAMNSTFIQLGNVCDSIHQSDCQIAADTEQNQTLVLPPVQSAMISTRDKVDLQYGRVVVRAKMPTGDWLRPQIALVSQGEEYGRYPASGMMTVFESRGNIAQHRLDQLNNEMISGLHWGPEDAPAYDRFYLTQGLYKVYRKFFNEKYYEFGMDWTPRSVTIWVNSRVRISFRYGFGRKFWDLGKFGYSYANGTIIGNPWQSAENQHIAPFDKPFYLRISLQAGGTDGYWMDSLPNKPWRNSDSRPQAMQRFLDYLSVWMPTWPSGDKIRDRGLAIDSIKLYQLVPRGQECSPL
ncbi:hypothetical protein Rhopal_003649-T1 [Rhodotorula paludigena]|uniref:GH16 domain-containing protein n=1 Tax=Rhodotorula paludigena TaxID=86838 RepID=A0AAV5GNP8_9BASI|nr:hypothetical protein Rhopal_003649-T1 [Rhodotorula paludigena]